MLVSDSQLDRLRSIDWTNKPEATISSQLLMPLLILLGYGEHTLHKVVEQRTYALRDPYVSKGSRRVRLDYEPTVYEEGLWVMEAKGTDSAVSRKTLGQVRDYAIHPEVRAALMVTVDAAGLRVYDPWDVHWDEPILHVIVNDVANRIEDIRAVLGADRVAGIIRRRHFDHLRAALSASVEFAVLADAEKEFRDVLDAASKSIDEKRRLIRREAERDAETLARRVEKDSGVWGAAQFENTPWTGTIRDARSLATAVLAQEEGQRPTQILVVRRVIEAVFRPRITEDADAWRPLWWLHVCRVASWPQLRALPGCEPYATDETRQALKDCLLNFRDDPLQAASWRLQRSLIPLLVRQGSGPELDRRGHALRESLSAENQIRFDVGPGWLLQHAVRNAAIAALASVDPWTVEHLDELADAAAKQLSASPPPSSAWHGTATDPWLGTWATTDQLRACTLDVLLNEPAADDLINEDPALLGAVRDASGSGVPMLERWAQPLLERLTTEG